MFVRSLNDVEKTDYFVDWGNGTSHRMLTEADGMGFTVCHTVVKKVASRCWNTATISKPATVSAVRAKLKT